MRTDARRQRGPGQCRYVSGKYAQSTQFPNLPHNLHSSGGNDLRFHRNSAEDPDTLVGEIRTILPEFIHFQMINYILNVPELHLNYIILM